MFIKLNRLRYHYKISGYHLLSFICKKAYKKLLFFCCFPISIFLTSVILLIRPFKKVVFVALVTGRIGHFSLNTELLLCSMEEEIYGSNFKQPKYVFYPGHVISNYTLYKMWKRVIPIFPFANIGCQVDRVLSFILGGSYKNNKYKKLFEWAKGDRDHNGYLASKKPHLFFTESEERKGESLKKKLGIAEGSKYICLLVRDSSYLKSTFPEGDWDYHNYRDSDISTYQLAAEYLAAKGYYVLRMGKVVKKAFRVDHPKVIDYANSPLRSDFLDVYLAANCECMITTSSGLDSVSLIFRRNIAYLNLVNYTCTTRYNKILVTLLKQVVYKDTGKAIDYDKVLPIFKKAEREGISVNDSLCAEGLGFVDNSSDEILDAVMRLEFILRDLALKNKQ